MSHRTAGGRFLSIEGVDGAGKTTQVDRLQRALQECGHEVCRVRDPGGTALGDQLRHFLLDRPFGIGLSAEALLFLASRAQLVEEQIRPALAGGKVVLTDRFTLSTVAYQGYAGGIAPELLWQAGALATGGIEPGLCFLLDLDPMVAAQRKQGPTDHVEKRPLDFHRKVRDGFRKEAANPLRNIQVLDATEDPERLHGTILTRVLQWIDSAAAMPLS